MPSRKMPSSPIKMPGPVQLKGVSKTRTGLGTFEGGPAPTVIPAVKNVPQNQMGAYIMSIGPSRRRGK